MKMQDLPLVVKNEFRKLKTTPPGLKGLLPASMAQGAYIQFFNDCRVYNVWEALLYVEKYAPELAEKINAKLAPKIMKAYDTKVKKIVQNIAKDGGVFIETDDAFEVRSGDMSTCYFKAYKKG
jgi:hypothetical protein